jgi:outer membrane protein assembly factor BamB
MSERFDLTESAIRHALTPPATVRAPLDLAAAIRLEIDATPQRRRPVLVLAVSTTDRRLRLLAIAAVLAMLALLAVFVVIGHRSIVPELAIVDEAMFRGGPARTGVVVGPGPTTTETIAWDQPVAGPIVANMPAIVGGVVYVADGSGAVTAFRAATGDALLSVNLGSPASTSPAVATGLVVVGDDAGDVVALDATNGAERWVFHTNGSVRSSPAIADGVVYVGSEDGHLYAIDLANGQQRWAFDFGGAITRSPAVSGGLVFAGADGGRFKAIDAATGQERWERTLDAGQIATPAVRDGVVLASSGLGTAGPHAVYGLDASTGKTRWTWASPSGQEVYVGGFDTDLAIVISADGNVYALDTRPEASTPLVRWRFKTGGPVGSAVAIAGGVVYVAGGDRTIYAVDEHAGTEIWAQAVSGQPGAIGIVGDRLYVATDLGRVIAITGTP